MPSKTSVKYRDLLVALAATEVEFVVIGSAALAIEGWEVTVGDLDVLAAPESVEAIRGAVGATSAEWVSEGAARRLECITPRGPVDIYVEVSGHLSYVDLVGGASLVPLGDSETAIRVGRVQHVRDMRAAAGRDDVAEFESVDAPPGESPRVIAIDGPAGAGKSTVTRALSEAIGFTHLDTGAMYRCVAVAVLGRRADPDDRTAIGKIARELSIQFEDERVLLDGKDVTAKIRTPTITEATPHFAAYPEVRSAMVGKQRGLFASGDGYVAEGRDITTVVAPGAPLKIYLTASLEERARRRALESEHEEARVLEALRERDLLDSEREVSALRIAQDAVVVDTSGRTIDGVVAEIIGLARLRGLIE